MSSNHKHDEAAELTQQIRADLKRMVERERAEATLQVDNATIAQGVITDWHDYEKWHDPSMMPIPPFSGAQEQELTRLVTEALNAKDDAYATHQATAPSVVTFDAKARALMIRALQAHSRAQDRDSPVGSHEAASADYIRDTLEEANEIIAEEDIARQATVEGLVEALKVAEKEASIAHDAIWSNEVRGAGILHDAERAESASAAIWRLHAATRTALALAAKEDTR